MASGNASGPSSLGPLPARRPARASPWRGRATRFRPPPHRSWPTAWAAATATAASTRGPGPPDAGAPAILSFDVESGVLRCEAGCTLGRWRSSGFDTDGFRRSSPERASSPLGGAVANDVHGKNHHRAGTFGRHVRALGLLPETGRGWSCGSAPATRSSATVGGARAHRPHHLGGGAALPSAGGLGVRGGNAASGHWRTLPSSRPSSDKTHAYTVAWVDGLARGGALGRGVFFRGNHAEGTGPRGPAPALDCPRRAGRAPLALPPARAFNALYRRWPRRGAALRLGVEIPPPTGRHWLLEPAVRRARPLAAPKRRPRAGGRTRAAGAARPRADRAPSSPC